MLIDNKKKRAGLICGELGGPSRQAHYMAIAMGAGSIASLCGPGVAGLTYGLIPKMPALVPCLIGSSVGLVATITACLFVPESR